MRQLKKFALLIALGGMAGGVLGFAGQCSGKT